MKRIFTIIAAVMISGCATLKTTELLTDKDLYTMALKDACIPTEDKVYNNLTAIHAKNKNLVRKTIFGSEYILTISLKSEKAKGWYKNDSKGFYNTGSYQIWVTVAPELQQRIKSFNSTNVKLRLKQLLGLPPNAEYTTIIEFWVKAEDLFRPCPDKEITDTRCNIDFPADATTAYKKWINDSRLDRYFLPTDIYSKYPWTELGYTYDWNINNSSHIGMSEFVIDVKKNVVVGNIYSIEEYFK